MAPTMPLPIRTAGIALALALSAPPASAQDASACWLMRGTHAEAAERPSPLDSASTRIGGAEVKVCYGAPSVRGREIMGGLLPWGEPWRAGANEFTSIRLAFPAEVAGVRLEPGAYGLYVIPGERSWTVVLSGQAERWGDPIDEGVRAADVGTGTVTPEATEGMVERLAFRFEPAGQGAADLLLEWERTRVRIPIRRMDG